MANIRIFDNGGETADRFTVVFMGTKQYNSAKGKYMYEMLGMSGNPTHPQGFCQHGEVCGNWLQDGNGKEITLEDLPEECRKIVERELVLYES